MQNFDNMRGAFGGFSDLGTAKLFQERLKKYVGSFCCLDEDPGRIYYDIFFDVIPRTDHRNRHWTGVWEPIPGQ